MRLAVISLIIMMCLSGCGNSSDGVIKSEPSKLSVYVHFEQPIDMPASEIPPGWKWDSTEMKLVPDASTAPVPIDIPGFVLDTAQPWDGGWHYYPVEE